MKNRKLFNSCMAGLLGAAMLMTSAPAMAAEFGDDPTGEGVTVAAEVEEAVEEEADPFSDKLRASTGTPIEKAYFPDTPFRSYVLKEIDKNKDRILSSAEIKETKKINVSGKKIKDLKGIEKFTYLEELNASDNSIASVNLTKNTKLIYINVGKNKLKTLDLSKCTKMETIVCSNNALTKITMPAASNLKKLNYMDVSHNKFTTQANAGLSIINKLTSTWDPVAKDLDEVNASYNSIATFNCSAFEGILDISNNKITKLTGGDFGYQARAIYVEGKNNTLSKTTKVDFASLGNAIPQQFSCNSGVKSKVAMVAPKITAKLSSDWTKVDIAVGSSSDFASYVLYKKTGSGSYVKVKSWAAGELDDPEFGEDGYTDTAVKPGNTYTYKLTVTVKVNDRNKKLVSWPVSKTVTVKTVPGTPALTVTSPKAGTAAVSWKAISGATGYDAYYGTSSTKVTSKLATGTTKVSLTKTKLTKGKTYYFRTRAYRTINGKKYYGSYSAVKKVKIK